MEIYDLNVLRFRLNPEINSVTDAEKIHDFLCKLEVKMALGTLNLMPHYRGEQFYGWEILPNIFRIKSLENDPITAKKLEKQGWLEFEKTIQQHFGSDALRNLFDSETFGKDWDLLMQSQHATIKTRLLDWSANVYSPLYFASEKSGDDDIDNADGQFWVYMTPTEQIKSHNEFPIKNTFYDQDPQDVKSPSMINVSIYLDDLEKRKYEVRMYHQRGRFFISEEANCNIPMNRQTNIAELMFRFKIPAASKQAIQDELKVRNIHYEYLFGAPNPAHQQLMDAVNKNVYGT